MSDAERDGGRVAILAAFAANLGIAVAKFVGFVFTGAASMLAEAIHSLADTANQGLLFLGRARANRAPDAAHPFGYGRVRYFWAFIVALVLFLAGGVFAIVEAIDKLQHPHKVDSLAWAIAILLLAMVLEGSSLRTGMREARPAKGDQSWWAFIRHTKSPELPVVLLEDTGAIVGLGFALAGLVLAAITGNARFDAIGSLAIGVLLVAIAVTLAIEMHSLLLGESARPFEVEAIRKAMEAGDDVVRVIHMRTEHLGPDELLIGAKLEFSRDLTVPQLAAAINAAEARARAVIPERCVMYVEPDIFDERRVPLAESGGTGTRS
jgi:cation diffusion facilitator family transporter